MYTDAPMQPRCLSLCEYRSILTRAASIATDRGTAPAAETSPGVTEATAAPPGATGSAAAEAPA